MVEMWYGAEEPAPEKYSLRDWLRILRRAIPLAVLVFGCLLILLAIRVVERPIYGARRPLTPFITMFVCRNAFRLMGIKFSNIGDPIQGAGAVVANHASWLDIFALNARKRIYFVSKAEVAGWPAIGWLARATGTVFIRRDRRDAAVQIDVFRERLAAGQRLLFFPEGTSTDGRRVLTFKPTLFAAFFDDSLRDTLTIQAVSVIYHAPSDKAPTFYGWWGDMDFAPHLLRTLAARKQGEIIVHYHPPVRVSDFADRKALAREMERQVRAGLAAHGIDETQ